MGKKFGTSKQTKDDRKKDIYSKGEARCKKDRGKEQNRREKASKKGCDQSEEDRCEGQKPL